MIMNKNTSKKMTINIAGKRLTLIALIIAFLIVVLYYSTFLSPIIEKTGLAKRELSSLQETINERNNKAHELETINANRDEIEGLIKQKIEDLPEDLDSRDIIYLLSQAKANKLNRRSLIFMEQIVQEDYRSYPVRFSFTTDYVGLTDFLIAIDALPNKPTLSNMQISFSNTRGKTPLAMEVDNEIRYDLDVEMTLNFYVRGNNEET